MKKSHKRLLPVALSVAMLGGLLAGCQSESPAAGGTAAPTSAEKPVIQFWCLPYGPTEVFDPAVQKLVDTYNAEDHGATVELQVLSWSGFAEQIQTAIAGGAPPDVTVASYHGLINYAAMGEAMDLSDIVEKWEAEQDPILQDFLPGQLDYGKFQGEQIALPFLTEGRAVYYRADILEDELGFTDLDKPVSWDKFLEICEAVKVNYGDEGMFPISFFTMDMGSTTGMMNILTSNGAGWLDEDGQPALDDPKAVECLEFFATMYDRGYFPDGMAAYNQADLEKLYDNGKLAMAWKSHFGHTSSNQELYHNTKVMGPIVGPGADEPRMCSWSDGILAFKQSKHPEETKEFVEWFIQNNASLFLACGSSSLPARTSFYEDPYYQDNWMVSQYVNYSDYFVLNTWPSREIPVATNQVYVQNMVGAPMEAVLMGSTDYAGEMAKANEAIKKVFEALN